MNTKSVQKLAIGKNTQNSKDSYSNVLPLVKTDVMGVGITNETPTDVLEYLVKIIQKTPKNLLVVTPNPEILLFANSHADFRSILNSADVALCDGMQLLRAARFMGKPLKGRIIGTDFVEMVCEKVANWPITVGFLGGRPGVAEKTAECLLAKYPKLKISLASSAYPQSFNPKPVDILFVAFGAPKQEYWMANNINKIPVRVMVGVGGAFDQIANPLLRPPRWMHGLGLGWMYRLVLQPWRIKRQVRLIEFLWLVLKEKFS